MCSKDYSWEFVIDDKKLSDGPCELLYANLVVSAATGSAVIYNGKNASGHEVAPLVSAVVTNLQFTPSVPVYCENGLYVDVGSNVTGVLVQWRELPVYPPPPVWPAGP